jgi:hypothetical protein
MNNPPHGLMNFIRQLFNRPRTMIDPLQGLVDYNRIDAIWSALVPAPPHAEFPGNHLIVNCRYPASVTLTAPNELLCIARSDLVIIVRLLIDNHLLIGSRSLFVRFLAIEPEETQGQRVYTYSLPNEGYPKTSDLITVEGLLNIVGIIESSELDSVSYLLRRGSPG